MGDCRWPFVTYLYLTGKSSMDTWITSLDQVTVLPSPAGVVCKQHQPSIDPAARHRSHTTTGLNIYNTLVSRFHDGCACHVIA